MGPKPPFSCDCPIGPSTGPYQGARAEWLLAELAEFYEPQEARLWLFAPHRLLGGERHADRIQQGRLDDVLALIAQLRDGAYV